MKLKKHFVALATGVITINLSACVGDTATPSTQNNKYEKIQHPNYVNSYKTSGIITKADLKIIFYDINNGKGYSGNLGGVSGADNLCQIASKNSKWHPNLPQDAKWKALIAVKGIREPGSLNNTPLDWVIQTGVTYMNESLEIFGIATEYSTLKYPSSVSLYQGQSINLAKNIPTYKHLQFEAWTGIQITNEGEFDKWSVSPWNCNQWNSNNNYTLTGELEPTNAFGNTGRLQGNIFNNTSIQFNTTEIDHHPSRCYNTRGLICVQQ